MFLVQSIGNIQKPRRVLMIVSTIGVSGGVQNTIMNVYRHIDKERVQFDFFVHAEVEESFEEEITSIGGKVYHPGRVESIGVLHFLRELYKVIKSEDYHAVHAHTGPTSGIFLFVAMLAGVKIRVAHSHGTSTNSRRANRVLPLLRVLIFMCATERLAASRESGYFLYKNRSFKVVKNALETYRFLNLDQGHNLLWRRKIGISDDVLVLGHVGRFSPEKNHVFLIRLANTLREKAVPFVMVLVGDGELKTEIMDLVRHNKLEEYFRFIGTQREIEKYFAMFDILLLPSTHEGFGNVALEAQVARKRVIASHGVSRDTDLGLGLIKFLSLTNIDDWINAILGPWPGTIPTVDDVLNSLEINGFAIGVAVQEYYEIYAV